MIAIIVSWLVILFVLFSTGDFLIYLYKLICKQNADYTFTDRFIAGMCAILIPLSATSLFFPSNHIVLLAFIALIVIYWIARRQHLKEITGSILQKLRNLSIIQVLIIALTLFSFIILCLYSSFLTFDPNYYHYQNIRWNEDYAVIPGLGNFEDRLGFNSNYLLLSALFTLRTLFGQPVYGLQSLLAVLLAVWILYETISSKFELKRLILFMLFFLLFYFSREGIADTSTDTIPNLVVFYLISNLILYPENIKIKPLLYIFVLISLVTFKLLFAPLCLISLYVLWHLAKDRKYKEISFLLIASSAIILLWLVRNVIITGYLVYPLGEVDLFSFDWKIPLYVVEKQREYISEVANSGFDYAIPHYLEDFTKSNPLLSWTTYFFLSIISIFVILIHFIKKKGSGTYLYFIFFVLYINIMYWLLTARDFRFCAGVILSMIFFAAAFLIKENRKAGHKTGTFIVFLSVLLISVPFTKSGSQYYHALKSRNADNIITGILAAPYSAAYKMEDSRIFEETSFGRGFEINPYKLSDSITVYITSHRTGSTYGVFPCTGDASIAKEWKMQDIRTIEARGNKLQDGFRPVK